MTDYDDCCDCFDSFQLVWEHSCTLEKAKRVQDGIVELGVAGNRTCHTPFSVYKRISLLNSIR